MWFTPSLIALPDCQSHVLRSADAAFDRASEQTVDHAVANFR